MGIINLDVCAFDYGMEVNNSYICIGNNPILVIKKEKDIYSISFDYTIFYNLESRNSNKNYMTRLSHTFEISEKDLDQNLYVLAYNKLKEIYPKHEDV